jgi:hypothetical protein
MSWNGDVVRHLAGQYQAILVDTQAALALDRVHLKPTGHIIILAQVFFKRRWNILGELGVHFPSNPTSLCSWDSSTYVSSFVSLALNECH